MGAQQWQHHTSSIRCVPGWLLQLHSLQRAELPNLMSTESNGKFCVREYITYLRTIICRDFLACFTFLFWIGKKKGSYFSGMLWWMLFVNTFNYFFLLWKPRRPVCPFRGVFAIRHGHICGIFLSCRWFLSPCCVRNQSAWLKLSTLKQLSSLYICAFGFLVWVPPPLC